VPPRPRTALGGAAIGVALLVLVRFLAFHVHAGERADQAILQGFAGLQRPRLNHVASVIANLCDPKPYLVLASIPVLVALVRRRPRTAVIVGLIMLGANFTTQLLKPLLATPRFHDLPGPFVQAQSWPSGHATAVMSLALCAVIVAPARLRPLVGAVMAAFAVALCYSFLALGWHYPSDVLGGYLVASVWALLGVAALSWLVRRRPASPRAQAETRRVQISVAEALAPFALLVACVLGCAAVVAVARPHEVVSYAAAHKTFVVGAAVIASLGLAIATGASLALRRG
jgi:membrane-associated phospholipid phosphatase